MTASTRRELRSAATSTSTTAIGLIRALTDARPIKPTSTRCLSARRPNPGRGSTYRRGNSVQTTAATSVVTHFFHNGREARHCVLAHIHMKIAELKDCVSIKRLRNLRRYDVVMPNFDLRCVPATAPI